VTTAQPSNSKAALARLLVRGGATFADKSFVPVIIGRNRFCPLIAANPAITKTCNRMAASSVSQKIT